MKLIYTCRLCRLLLLLAMLAIFIAVPALAIGTDSGVPPEVTKYSKDWPLPNQDYGNTRTAASAIITSNNIDRLGVAWSMPITGITAYGGAASTPLIMGSTVYFQDLKSNVYALDLRTGDVVWKNMLNTTNYGPNGPAVGWNKVFVVKGHYSVSALNLSTGKEVWSAQLSTVNTTGIDIQPQVYDGLVYTSTVPGTSDLNWYTAGGIGIIYALDQATGKVNWSFSTIDSPNLWGHPEINSGGGCWYTPAVDTMLGKIYWGIANPAPFPGTKDYPNGASRPGPNLYTDSMMALDHSTGKIAWFNQAYPHDMYDHDLQIAPVLASGTVSGKHQDMVIGSGKVGKVFAYNRSTGALLWATDVGEHNQNDQLDLLPPGTTRVQPAIIGGVETPMAYANGMLYVPVIDMFSDWTPTSFDTSTFNFSQGKGELVAINVSTGKVLWYKVLDSIDVGGATVVNDLVLTATYDGTIYAFDRETGDRVWKYKAPSGINGWPAVAGDTIVWPCGVGGKPSLIAFRLGVPGVSPQAMIESPKDGSIMPKGDVNVSIHVENFNLTEAFGQANVSGRGHIHYFMDTRVPTASGRPAVTANGTWVQTASTSYTWRNVAPGAHNFSIELVNNDHTPLSPPIVDTVTVTLVQNTSLPAKRPSFQNASRTMNLSAGNISASRQGMANISMMNASMTNAGMANATAMSQGSMSQGLLNASTIQPTGARPQIAASNQSLAAKNVSVDLVARNIAFDKSTISVPAGARVTVNFDNQDTGVPHNFAAYDSQQTTKAIFIGEIINGPRRIAYTFNAPAVPGTYFFRCDVHPATMTGSFVVV